MTHVYLINPSGGEAANHTLIYVKGQWLVLEGYMANRENLPYESWTSLEYQRKMFSAMQKNTLWALVAVFSILQEMAKDQFRYP